MDDIQKQITETAGHIAALTQEQKEFGSKMSEAAQSGNADSIIELKRRQSELPIQLEAARITHTKLLLEADQERSAQLQTEVGKFFEPIQELIQKRDAAQLELAKMQGQYHGVNEDLRDVRIRIGERRRELERLIFEATPKPPGLRSLQNMGGR
jgi:septal ring factor EnvC (AmiA/AmiB activator)